MKVLPPTAEKNYLQSDKYRGQLTASSRHTELEAHDELTEGKTPQVTS